MRIIVLFFCCILILPALFSNAAAPVKTTSVRDPIGLVGDWQYQLDPSNTVSWTDFAASLPHSATVQLPVCWAGDPHTRNYQGAIWYAHALTFPSIIAGEDLSLVVENPIGIFDFYLDGVAFAHGFGNGLTQHFAISGAAGSTHQLAIHLDTAHLPEGMRLVNAGGIGPIHLDILPPVRLENVIARYRPADDALELSYGVFANTLTQVRVIVRLLDNNHQHQVGPTTTVTLDLLPGINEEAPLLISLKHADSWITAKAKNATVYLLDVEVMNGKISLDRHRVEVGKSNITAIDSTLQVNGIPETFRGLRLPGGLPPMIAHNLPDTYSTELSLMHDAGFNAMMTDGAALPDSALRFADQLGMMVIAEVPLTEIRIAGTSTFNLDFSSALAQQGHHPCIVAWRWTSLGNLSAEMAAFRREDYARPALVHTQDGTLLFLPSAVDGRKISDIDALQAPTIALVDDHALLAERLPLPYLVSGTPVHTETDLDDQGIESEARYFAAIRQTVESVRCARYPFGYFIRPLRGNSLTGLLPGEGAPLKTRAYFAAVGYNQPRLIALRLGTDNQPEVTLINDTRETSSAGMTRLVTTPNGLTNITHTGVGQDITIQGDRLQNLSEVLPALDIRQPGEYHLQYILTSGAKVIVLSQVLTFNIGNADQPIK